VLKVDKSDKIVGSHRIINYISWKDHKIIL